MLTQLKLDASLKHVHWATESRVLSRKKRVLYGTGTPRVRRTVGRARKQHAPRSVPHTRHSGLVLLAGARCAARMYHPSYAGGSFLILVIAGSGLVPACPEQRPCRAPSAASSRWELAGTRQFLLGAMSDQAPQRWYRPAPEPLVGASRRHSIRCLCLPVARPACRLCIAPGQRVPVGTC